MAFRIRISCVSELNYRLVEPFFILKRARNERSLCTLEILNLLLCMITQAEKIRTVYGFFYHLFAGVRRHIHPTRNLRSISLNSKFAFRLFDSDSMDSQQDDDDFLPTCALLEFWSRWQGRSRASGSHSVGLGDPLAHLGASVGLFVPTPCSHLVGQAHMWARP